MGKRHPVHTLYIIDRYRLIIAPVMNGWEVYDTVEAMEQNDPLGSGSSITEAVSAAAERLGEWISE